VFGIGGARRGNHIHIRSGLVWFGLSRSGKVGEARNLYSYSGRGLQRTGRVGSGMAWFGTEIIFVGSLAGCG
jgi:hypothetical protein